MRPIFASFAVVLGAALSLGGCGPAPDAAPPADAPAPTTPTPAPAPQTPAPSAAAQPVRYFYFGNHVPRTEITDIQGVDTAHAVLKGVTTAEDAYAYCFEGMGDRAAAATQCAGQRKPQPEQMTADCIARTVSDGGPAVWIRDEPAPNGKIRPVWKDRASGQIRDYSGAGGGYVLTAAFRILCPAASTRITTQD